MKKRIIICTCVFIAVISIVLAAFLFTKSNEDELLSQNETEQAGVILSASPSGIIFTSEEQKVDFTVTALPNSSVKIKVGTKKYAAKETKEKNNRSVYKATVVMPKSKVEIESLGSICAVADYNGQAYTAEIATVVYKAESKGSTKEDVSKYLNSITCENKTNEKEETTKNNTEKTPTAAVNQQQKPSTYTDNGVYNPAYNGTLSGTLCMVMGPGADTWPGENQSTVFVPYYSPLIYGTMDFVVSESENKDSEKNVNRSFYTLASGRRVLKKYVTLMGNNTLPENEMAVASASCQNGEAQIVLSEKWRVPFYTSLTPQTYFSEGGRKYNVNACEAEKLQFTFYYTSSVTGEIDVSGSDIVSGASFELNSKNKTAVLTLPLRQKGKYYGYSAAYDESGNLVITVHNRLGSLSGSVILLDPGHGGKDSGALGMNGQIYESQINFANAVEVKNELEARGATVYLTRYDNLYLSLEERKQMIYSLKPDIFISLHSDAADSKDAIGTSVFYHKAMSQPLAKEIFAEMSNMYSTYMYPTEPEKAQKAMRGYKYYPFSVTRVEDCPAVLIEVGYMTNDAECIRFTQIETRKKAAAAIANGIEKYFLSQQK